MTREEIEQLYVEEPNCFETGREEQWYKVGLKEGLAAADSHPQWIPVEEELPKEQGKYMFRLSNGDMCYETYYPKLKLLDNVTHWMEIQPPRKEDNK